MRPLPLGTVTYNIAKDWDLPTLIENARAVGLDAVELRTTHAHGVEPALSPAARAEVKARFADSPVRLATLGSTCEYHSPDPAEVRQNIEETKTWVRLARDVGAGSVKVRPNGLPKEVPPEKTLAQIGKALAECAAFAREHGVLLQLEVHGRGTAELPNVRRILDEAGTPPALKVCWNSNPQDLEGEGLEANFRLVQSQIGQVHMHDLYDPYPYDRLIRLLHDAGCDGICFAELGEPSSDGVRVLRYWRGMFRALEGRDGSNSA